LLEPTNRPVCVPPRKLASDLCLMLGCLIDHEYFIRCPALSQDMLDGVDQDLFAIKGGYRHSDC